MLSSAIAKSSISLYIWPLPPHLIKTTSANTSKTVAYTYSRKHKKIREWEKILLHALFLVIGTKNNVDAAADLMKSLSHLLAIWLRPPPLIIPTRVCALDVLNSLRGWAQTKIITTQPLLLTQRDPLFRHSHERSFTPSDSTSFQLLF